MYCSTLFLNSSSLSAQLGSSLFSSSPRLVFLDTLRIDICHTSREPSYGESDVPTFLPVYGLSIPTTNQEMEKGEDSDDLVDGYDVDEDNDGYNEDNDGNGDDDENDDDDDELRKRADEFIAKITKGWQQEKLKEKAILMLH
ncbi:hypothetical protein MRB53_019832 [Persea americana]|uniref:Uncharacterized protein n=1 Tax=Persea americana TaxID=3435 RepID=A0ACC2KZS5_PERAE|nr:hypothetical protein MRB53_019832 [Persea americana]